MIKKHMALVLVLITTLCLAIGCSPDYKVIEDIGDAQGRLDILVRQFYAPWNEWRNLEAEIKELRGSKPTFDYERVLDYAEQLEEASKYEGRLHELYARQSELFREFRAIEDELLEYLILDNVWIKSGDLAVIVHGRIKGDGLVDRYTRNVKVAECFDDLPKPEDIPTWND